jgi:hypothetical protein
MRVLTSWARGISLERKRALRPLQHALGVLTCLGDLTRLARYFDSDKAGGHHYTQHYETHFGPVRRKPLTVLEIGVGGNEDPASGGASLRMWKAYFPHARIVGIDLYDKRSHDAHRIKTYRGSQADPAFLQRVVDEIGQPDIVIDDGSHRCEHVIVSFRTLFPRISHGGIYVCEDLQTSYWPEYGGSESAPDAPSTSMGYFKSLVHGLNHAEYRSMGYAPSELDRSITAMHFYHNMVFIRKGRNDEASFHAGRV